MQLQTLTTALVAALLTKTTYAAPLNNIVEILQPRTNAPVVPFGINLWGFDHLDCQGKPGRRPATFQHMQYNTPYSVGSDAKYSYALTRPLAEDEELQFYTGDMEEEGSWCAQVAYTADWTVHMNTCTALGWVNCVKLVKK